MQPDQGDAAILGRHASREALSRIGQSGRVAVRACGVWHVHVHVHVYVLGSGFGFGFGFG
eukprot:1355211-Prymnesium_polylepis.1